MKVDIVRFSLAAMLVASTDLAISIAAAVTVSDEGPNTRGYRVR
jgi:hypothetical protein